MSYCFHAVLYRLDVLLLTIFKDLDNFKLVGSQSRRLFLHNWFYNLCRFLDNFRLLRLLSLFRNTLIHFCNFISQKLDSLL